MSSLPLTIACLVALLPIRLTICGDPLTWASIDAQAEFKMKPDGGPGGDCSLPSTFQMRADGSWLSSSVFEFTGNLDDDCGVYLHLTIPEDEPKEENEFESKIKQLNKDMEALLKEEDRLTNEKTEHEKLINEKSTQEGVAKKLANEKIALDEKKLELATIRSELQNQEERKKVVNARRIVLEDKKNMLGEYTDEALLVKFESGLAQEKSRLVKKMKLLNELLRLYEGNLCTQIIDSDYLMIKDELDVHQQDILVCEPEEI